MALYVGTSGFSYPEWKGSFYPADLPEKQMLHFYGTRFSTVEINNTFHRMPTAALLAAWGAEVPSDFRFALKAPQRITHLQRLKGVEDSVSYLCDIAGILKQRLGPLLFQLPPSLRKDVPLLHDFLALLPPGIRVAFQFGHSSWFDDEIFRLLRRNNAALCVVDAAEGIEVPLVGTADWGYLRMRRPGYGEKDLERWVEQVQSQQWSDAFVFFKHEEEALGPLLAQRFLVLSGGKKKTKKAGVAAGREPEAI